MSLIKFKKFRWFFFLIICMWLAGCGGNISVLPGIPELEAETLKLINEKRATNEKPLPELTMDARIVEQARKHSSDLANGKVPFGHVGVDKRIKATGIACNGYAENEAMNSYDQSITVETAVNKWMTSPGHCTNILGNYDLTGIGVVEKNGEYYYTQIFIESR